MKGKREADNNFNFNFKSEKLDELRSRVDAAGAAEQGQYAEGSQPAAGR